MKCGKVCHRNREGAMSAWTKTGRIASLRPYFCRTCRAWHLGNRQALAGARIDQLLNDSAAHDAAKRSAR